MSKVNNLADFLTDVAGSIRSKKGYPSTQKINPQNFSSEIAGIKTTPTLQQKTVSPSASSQSVTPDSGYDGLSKVTVNGDSDLVAGNIKSGVSIFGVSGNYSGVGSGSPREYVLEYNENLQVEYGNMYCLTFGYDDQGDVFEDRNIKYENVTLTIPAGGQMYMLVLSSETIIFTVQRDEDTADTINSMRVLYDGSGSVIENRGYNTDWGSIYLYIKEVENMFFSSF